MRFAPVKTDYFDLKGGLNLVTPPLSVPPGFCREAQNYEIGVDGGYRRIDGYCRFDGRPSPSDATYHMLPCTITGSVSAGNTVTGSVSGATGKVIAVEVSAVVITQLTGTFNSSENLNVSGTPQATMTSSPIQEGGATNQLNWQYKKLAEDVYRTSIAAVPGQGDLLGVWRYSGVVYAFRNAVGGATAVMWKSSAGGWVSVRAGLNPNGKYEFVSYNFGSGLKMYGCDGANKAFQFDGTTYTEITTGMAFDGPTHIAAHVNHLFLSFNNSLQHSAIGNPLSWTPVLGAGELNMGLTISNLLPQPGDANGAALGVWTRDPASGNGSTAILYGTSSANWKLVTINPDASAFPSTAQWLGTSFVFDDRGVTTLQTSQNYGNFDAASISKLIRPWVVENKSRILCSGISRDKNQYRLFFNGGRAMYYTIDGGFMPMMFAHSFTCYCSMEDGSGDEVAYAGGSDGYVYEMDRGNSFDGAPIEAYATLVFNHLKSPRVLKFYRKAILEVAGNGYSDFWMSADLGYSSTEYDPIPLSQQITSLSSGKWDTGTWDVGVWDGRILAPAEIELTGTAENIALRIAQISDYQAPLTFFGVLINYSPRRALR